MSILQRVDCIHTFLPMVKIIIVWDDVGFQLILSGILCYFHSSCRFFFGKNKVMIIALGRDREAEYKENLHKIANVSIARAINKGRDQRKAYVIIWYQLIFCSAFTPDSGHCFVYVELSDVSDYNKDTAKQMNILKMIGELSTTIPLICHHLLKHSFLQIILHYTF